MNIEKIREALQEAISIDLRDNEGEASLYTHQLREALAELDKVQRPGKVLTIDEAMEACWRWAIDAKMVNATTEPYYLNNDLRTRLTAAIEAKTRKQ